MRGKQIMWTAAISILVVVGYSTWQKKAGR